MSDELRTWNEWIEMTYPCYFAMKGDSFLTLTSEGDKCFVLMTDKDIVERYYREMHPNQETITVEVFTMENREALLQVLQDMEKQGPAQGVSHLAIDPTKGGVGRVSVREFIDELEKSPRS